MPPDILASNDKNEDSKCEINSIADFGDFGCDSLDNLDNLEADDNNNNLFEAPQLVIFYTILHSISHELDKTISSLTYF